MGHRAWRGRFEDLETWGLGECDSRIKLTELVEVVIIKLIDPGP
jgi:hypothetical protein